MRSFKTIGFEHFRSRIALYSLAIVLAVSASTLVWWSFLNDRFRLENIYQDLPLSLNWTSSPPRDLDLILNQPFTYLDKGHQTYVFESSDHRYVLKFVKFTYLKPSWIDTYSPQRVNGISKRLERVVEGHRIAFENAKEESALLYVQMGSNPDQNGRVKLIDSTGFSYNVDLSQCSFVLQRKGAATKEVIRSLLKKGHLSKAQEALAKIIELYLSGYAIGLYDSDHNVMSNTGFIDHTIAVRLDVGRLKLEPSIMEIERMREDLHNVAYKRINKWLLKYFPDYAVELMEYLKGEFPLLNEQPPE